MFSLIHLNWITDGSVFIVCTSAWRTIAARLAQSVEHQTFNLRVKGSSPLPGLTFRFPVLHRDMTVILRMFRRWLLEEKLCSLQSVSSNFKHLHSRPKRSPRACTWVYLWSNIPIESYWTRQDIVLFSSHFISGRPGRDRIVVSTSRCGRDNPGSNPGHGKTTAKPTLFLVIRSMKISNG